MLADRFRELLQRRRVELAARLLRIGVDELDIELLRTPGVRTRDVMTHFSVDTRVWQSGRCGRRVRRGGGFCRLRRTGDQRAEATAERASLLTHL